MYKVNNGRLLTNVNVVIVNFDNLNDCFTENYVDFFKRHENEDLSDYYMELEILHYGEYSMCGSSGHLSIRYFAPDDDEGKSPNTLPHADKFIPMFLEDTFGFKPSMIVVDGAMIYIFTEEDLPKDY